MRIAAVEAMVLRLPNVTAACDGTQDTCLIRVETDDGVIGWGEVDSAPTVVKAIIDAPLSHQICNGIANALIGADPVDLEACTVAMEGAVNYYGRSGPAVHAMAGVNIALWDIAGKAAGVPVSQLLGGARRTRLRAYASVLFGDSPDLTEELGRRLVGSGFTAVKFGWGPMGQDERMDIELVASARRGLGPDADLLVDAGQVWDAVTALSRARSFVDHNVFWLEEPLRQDDLTGYAELTASSPIPIAAGEAESRLSEFKQLLAVGRVNWIQPDPGRCGISVMRAVGEEALAAGRRMCNHSFKSAITLSASLHVLAALPEAELVEFCMTDSPLCHELTNEYLTVVDGMVEVPTDPGLGVTINLDTVQKYRVA